MLLLLLSINYIFYNSVYIVFYSIVIVAISSNSSEIIYDNINYYNKLQ